MNRSNKPLSTNHFLITACMIMAVTVTVACRRNHTPKPRGYFRIDLPQHAYREYRSDCPFSFELPVYTNVQPDQSRMSRPCWFNIVYPDFNGTIHLSYQKVKGNLKELTEDARTLAYKHSIKADAIGEQLFIHPDKKVYGILYDIKGNAASSVQFFLTDSSRHFIRGALYFSVSPNADSLAPVIRFCREDVIHLIETFSWR